MSYPSAYVRGGKCSECGSTAGFEHYHLESKETCSPSCRKRRQRRQAAARSAWAAVIRELSPMRDAIKRREELEEYRTKLIRLRDEINDLLLLANDPDQQSRREMLEGRSRHNS